MADFAQGLDASKLILAETVRFIQLLQFLYFTPSSHALAHAHSCSRSSSAHTLPLRTTCPSFSLVYTYKRAKKQPLAYFKWQVLSSQLTAICTERADDSLRVIWLPPLYSTSYGSSKTAKRQ